MKINEKKNKRCIKRTGFPPTHGLPPTLQSALDDWSILLFDLVGIF